MLVTGAAAAWLEAEDSAGAFHMGARAALHVLRCHVNGPVDEADSGCGGESGRTYPYPIRWPHLPPHALVECVKSPADGDAAAAAAACRGTPWVDSSGRVLCDPGHTVEWVGLVAKFLHVAAARGRLDSEPALLSLAHRLPSVLFAAFDLGFRPGPGGIVKGVDLLSGADTNSDMPWWSLPEAMRAAAFVCAIVRSTWWQRRSSTDSDRERDDAVLARARRVWAQAEAALARYERVVPVEGAGRPLRLRLLVQTRDASGRDSGAIPATPDLDPGYHTGLCLIDCRHLETADASLGLTR